MQRDQVMQLTGSMYNLDGTNERRSGEQARWWVGAEERRGGARAGWGGGDKGVCYEDQGRELANTQTPGSETLSKQ